MLESVLGRIKERLWWGVREELLGLFTPKIPTMTAAYAQALHRAGFRDLVGLATADDERIFIALRAAKGRPGSTRLCRTAARSLGQEARDATAAQVADHHRGHARMDAHVDAHTPWPRPMATPHDHGHRHGHVHGHTHGHAHTPCVPTGERVRGADARAHARCGNPATAAPQHSD